MEENEIQPKTMIMIYAFLLRESMTAKEEAYSRYEKELAASLGALLVSFFFI